MIKMNSAKDPNFLISKFALRIINGDKIDPLTCDLVNSKKAKYENRDLTIGVFFKANMLNN